MWAVLRQRSSHDIGRLLDLSEVDSLAHAFHFLWQLPQRHYSTSVRSQIINTQMCFMHSVGQPGLTGRAAGGFGIKVLKYSWCIEYQVFKQGDATYIFGIDLIEIITIWRLCCVKKRPFERLRDNQRLVTDHFTDGSELS